MADDSCVKSQRQPLLWASCHRVQKRSNLVTSYNNSNMASWPSGIAHGVVVSYAHSSGVWGPGRGSGVLSCPLVAIVCS